MAMLAEGVDPLQNGIGHKHSSSPSKYIKIWNIHKQFNKLGSEPFLTDAVQYMLKSPQIDYAAYSKLKFASSVR